MKLINKILAILFSSILCLSALSFVACDKDMITVTFVQNGAENVAIKVEKGNKINKLPKINEISENYLITEWNISEDFVATQDVTINTISYTEGLTFKKGTYNGKTVYSVSGYTSRNPKVVVPAYYRGGQVRSVASQIFWGNSDIIEVVLPEGLVTIGLYAFCNTKNLVKVTLPSTLTNLQSHVFGDSALEGTLSVPELVEIVEDRAFWNTRHEIIYTNNIKSAGSFAFGGKYCETVVWGLDLVSVWDSTFYLQPIKQIFYFGDESDWKNIEFKADDYVKANANSQFGAAEKLLKEAKVYYYSEWQMVNGVPTPL